MSKKDDLTGFFDNGVKITGEIEFQNTLRIDGLFTGKIRSTDLLVIGDQGSVDGEIEVGTLSVNGIVKGIVRTKDRLEIQKTGRVYADVSTPSLFIVEGGILQGKCEMEVKGQVKAADSKPQK
jgi:cytoskeletal protein CcmA (bactofilin family)